MTRTGKRTSRSCKAGEAVYTAPLIPHSPRFPPDAFLLVQERQRRPGEIDRFQWFCPECDSFLHEEEFVVADYGLDPVSKAYSQFLRRRGAPYLHMPAATSCPHPPT